VEVEYTDKNKTFEIEAETFPQVRKSSLYQEGIKDNTAPVLVEEKRSVSEFIPQLDMYDTDLGELQSYPINERYREFKVSKPIKNMTHITYEVTGYFFDLNKSVAVIGNKAPA